MPQPHPSPTPAPPAVKPKCIPNGTGEVGIEAILPVFVGPKGGFQVDSRGIYPTWGISAGTPGKGVSVTGTASKATVSPGLSFGFSINVIVGFSFQTGPITHAQPSFRQAIRNGSFQFGGGTPGESVNATVVHDTPRFIRNRWYCQ